MKNFLEKKYEVEISNVDRFMNLSLVSIMKIFQDMATKHSTILGISYFDLQKRDNAFWVLSKFRVKVKNSLPVWGDEICVKTYPLVPQNIKSIRNYEIKKNKLQALIASSEWCILDNETRKPRRTSSILCYSNAVNYLKDNIETESFSRIDNEVDEIDYVYDIVVRLCDLDVNNHMNNVVYTEIALNCFTSDFFSDKKLKEYEIHFLKEAKEGDLIRVYKKKYSDGSFIVVGKTENTSETIFKVKIDFDKM